MTTRIVSVSWTTYENNVAKRQVVKRHFFLENIFFFTYSPASNLEFVLNFRFFKRLLNGIALNKAKLETFIKDQSITV